VSSPQPYDYGPPSDPAQHSESGSLASSLVRYPSRGSACSKVWVNLRVGYIIALNNVYRIQHPDDAIVKVKVGDSIVRLEIVEIDWAIQLGALCG